MDSFEYPLLSEYDPMKSAEGAIDPLGLYTIADSLGVQLVPGIRERMSRPRFLTAMAVGNAITRYFEDHIMAADGQSEPWMVYEWYAVEGIVRSRGDDPDLSRLPGVQKARDCIRDGMSMSAPRYLKTPTVFGFHGVYRLLADNLDIIRNDYLGDNGYRLLTTWEKEQNMGGFVSGQSGPGVSFRHQIESAVEDGIKKGATSRSGSWSGWRFFGNHLFPNRIPPMEAEVMRNFFLSPPDSSRMQVIKHLKSQEGHQIFDDTKSEKEFHLWLLKYVDENTKTLLEAILHYEKFARLLQDAFDDCRQAMTAKRAKTSPSELSKTPGCREAHSEIPNMFEDVAERLEPFGQTTRFLETFGSLAEKSEATIWTETLLDHHISVQRKKPPNGKNPWFARLNDGSVVIRARYQKPEGGRRDGAYVNAYRTNPLVAFLSDLEML